MENFTVILRYPDYASASWPDETYCVTVEANDGDAAIIEAQRDAMVANTTDGGECGIEDASDFAVIAVFPGHLEQSDWG